MKKFEAVFLPKKGDKRTMIIVAENIEDAINKAFALKKKNEVCFCRSPKKRFTKKEFVSIIKK